MPVARKRILIVEDDEPIRSVLAMYLRRAGYRVNTAKGRDRASAVIRRGGVDLVIADTGIRGNGHAAAGRWNIPVLLMSGHPERIHQRAGGATPFIAKPFRPEELLARVRELIG